MATTPNLHMGSGELLIPCGFKIILSSYSPIFLLNRYTGAGEGVIEVALPP